MSAPVAHLLALARYENRTWAGDFAVGSVTGPVNLDQLEALLGCWYLVDHPGLTDEGTKTVVAACSQEALDTALAGCVYDPFYGQPHMAALDAAVSLVQTVLDGAGTLTAAQVAELLSHLVIHHVKEG